MHTLIKMVKGGGPGRRATYRVSAAPTAEALKLDARTAEGKAAGLLVTYVRGSRGAADQAAWILFNAVCDRAKVTL
jgi:hypothetical protein